MKYPPMESLPTAKPPKAPEQLDPEYIRFIRFRQTECQLKPVDVAKSFLHKLPVCSHGERLYIFTRTHYESPDEIKIKQKIVETCRDEYKQVESPRFVDSVYDALLLEPGSVMPDKALYNKSSAGFSIARLFTPSASTNSRIVSLVTSSQGSASARFPICRTAVWMICTAEGSPHQVSLRIYRLRT